MKKTQIIKSVLLFTILITFTRCDDFLDVNADPDNPTVSTPSLTLPVAQQTFLELNSNSMNYLGNFMVYNWATPSNWSANENVMRYNFTNTTNDEIFETSYGTIFKDLAYVETFEDGTKDYTAFKVISNVIKGFQYQYLVDLYGDIPYTEANFRGENRTPAYDDARTIYKDLVDKLTTAASDAVNTPANAVNPGSQDIIFGGDMTLWAKLANTVKLRYLIRLSNAGEDAFITSEIAKITANGAGFIENDAFGNPGYSDNDNKQNPFWDYLGSDPTLTTRNDRNDYTVASDFTLAYLTDTNDPRLEQIYSETDGGGYKGAPQTTTLPATLFTAEELSHVGEGLLKGPDADQIIMLAAESMLLQAEAMVRGYLPGGEAAAKTMYESAIEASFDFLGASDASTYYGQQIVNVSWDSSSNKLEAIAVQKWVALNGVSGIESWIELTRTGFPLNIPVPVDSTPNGNGSRPVSLLYPASELATNSNNVPLQTKDMVFTNTPFWK